MSLDVEGLVKVANRLVLISQRLPSNINPTDAGGYLTIGLDGFSTKYILEIGTPNPAERGLYWRFSQEKAHRLYSDWLRNPAETFSSWQTRQREANKYGGAVLFDRTKDNGRPLCDIISFSGHTEHVDEAISLTLGNHLEIATPAVIDRIRNFSNNQVFVEMNVEASKRGFG